MGLCRRCSSPQHLTICFLKRRAASWRPHAFYVTARLPNVAGMADSSNGGSDASSCSSRGSDTDMGSVSDDWSEASDDSSGTSSSTGSSHEDRIPKTKRSELMHSPRSAEKLRRPRPRTARSNGDEVVETWEEHVRSCGEKHDCDRCLWMRSKHRLPPEMHDLKRLQTGTTS